MGNWGIGKTTFLEFLSEELKQEKNIIEIKFCPWLLESEKHYTEDLLNKIGFELKKYHSEGDTKMKNYLKSILKSLKFEVAGIASISIENFFTQNTFHNDIEIINRIIERTGKKIVIFIDDIDRMEGKEILKIFKLIRNVANFKNTFFIIPYDKEYINQCLIEEKIENSFEFMKKFFQYELHLRKNKIENIRLLLINELDKWLDIKKEEVIDSTKKDVINNIQISLKENNSELLIEKAIFNFRDVYRFMNVFAENFTNELIGEVYFPDFFNITLLRYGYPTIYDTLFYKKEELVTNIQINKSDYNVLTDSLLEHYVIKEPNDKKLDDILRENSVEYNISSKDINNVNSLLQDLFLKEYSKTGMWESEKKNNPFKNKELSLKYIIYYDKYFEHSMQGNLSEIEFQTAMTKSTDEIFYYILSKTKNIEELTFKLNRINFSSFERRENYESFFQALCKIISDDSDKFYRKHNLSELILYYDSTKNKKLNKFYQNEDDYLDFIFTTLKEFDTVSNNLFNIFNEKYLSSFTLENSSFSKNYFERLRNYSIERFNTFLENEKSYSWNLWYAFMSLEKINEKNIDFKKNYAENKEKLKLFIIKYLDNFICNNKGSYCIRFCRQHRNNYQFEKDLIVELFGSIDAFIKTLQESDSIYLEDIKLLNDTIEESETGCAGINLKKINLPRNREF